MKSNKIKFVIKFVFIKIKQLILWEFYFKSLRDPKLKGTIPHDPIIQEKIVQRLKQSNIKVVEFEIDISEFKGFLDRAAYQNYPKYYGLVRKRNLIEKSLEHFIAAKVLEINKEDIYIDIANSNSPSPEIYNKIYKCKTYRQDLIFPEGINGNVIGGNACNMPIEDEFATKMALHCSFEHFVGNSDIEFIKEANRVLKKGGKLCIIPLYLYKNYAIQTDPSSLPLHGINFEEDAILYCVNNTGIQHNRFYDIKHLNSRIRKNLGNLKMSIYVIKNEKRVHTSCYVKFFALFEKY